MSKIQGKYDESYKVNEKGRLWNSDRNMVNIKGKERNIIAELTKQETNIKNAQNKKPNSKERSQGNYIKIKIIKITRTRPDNIKDDQRYGIKLFNELVNKKNV